MSSNCQQETKLAEIGAQLKQMREIKDISLNQVTATTLISERHLKAIEEGNLHLLPEPVYVQGFIRKYGSTLGLDSLADDFPVFTEVNPRNKAWSGSPAAELRPFHLYGLYILVITGAVSVLASFLNPAPAIRSSNIQTKLSKSAQLPVPSDRLSPNAIANQPYGPEILGAAKGQEVYNLPKATETTKTASVFTKGNNQIALAIANPSAFVQQGAINSSLKSSETWSDLSSLVSQASFPQKFSFVGNKPVNVGITMNGQSWVRVGVDGETRFEGILSEGTNQAWSAEDEVIIRAGNAGAVSVTFNRLGAEQLGAEGEVVQREFDQNYQPSPKPEATQVSSSLQTNWFKNIVTNN